MDAFLFISAIGLLVMFSSVGLALAYRIIFTDKPIVNQTYFRTTNIHKNSKEDIK